MCGIAGYYNTSGRPVGNTETILRMLQVQRHRGPDDAGIRAFSLVHQNTLELDNRLPEAVADGYEGVLGFNRLSILDLSANGHQPMCNRDETVMLVFNGEVYNAFDFKASLERDGFIFRSHTDTEIILNLYIKHGFDGMVGRLNGMFAIALVDLRERCLYLARDRFGIKPLYVHATQDSVAFASEVKSFLQLPDFLPTLDKSLIDEFLIFRNNIHQSLFQGVEALEPGTYRKFTRGGSSTTRFFSINSYSRVPTSEPMDQSLKRLEPVLERSVGRQLISDVKLGCQLSGGIDSTLVTYHASRQKKDDLLETISVVFNDEAFSEEPYINLISNKLNLRAHKFVLDATYYLNQFQRATWHFESPLNHPNTIGIYLLSQQAKQHVTVLLSGEGADEVFGGYDRFASVARPYSLSTISRSVRKHADSLASHVFAYPFEDYRAITASAFMSQGMARRLRSDFDQRLALGKRRELYTGLTGEVFDKQVKYELLTYLPDLLMRQDKMSMAHSIENRVPYLDNEVVAASFEIPGSNLLYPTQSGLQTKMALKALASRLAGDSFAHRVKGGFGIPLREFFSSKEFTAYLSDEIVPAIRSRGIFDAGLVGGWIGNLGMISSAELEALWIMVAFEAWALQYKI